MVSGGVGILLAVCIYAASFALIILAHRLLNPYAMIVFAPAMILGLAEPTSIRSTLSLLAIVLGTNFVLYGILGLLLFGAWSLFQHLMT